MCAGENEPLLRFFTAEDAENTEKSYRPDIKPARFPYPLHLTIETDRKIHAIEKSP